MDRMKDGVGRNDARYLVGHVSIPNRYFCFSRIKKRKYNFFPLRL